MIRELGEGWIHGLLLKKRNLAPIMSEGCSEGFSIDGGNVSSLYKYFEYILYDKCNEWKEKGVGYLELKIG